MEHAEETGGEHHEKHDDEGRHDDEEANALLEELKKSIEAKLALRQVPNRMKQPKLEGKQDIKRLVLEYNDRDEEELNGGAQPPSWTQIGGRAVNQGHMLDGQN